MNDNIIPFKKTAIRQEVENAREAIVGMTAEIRRLDERLATIEVLLLTLAVE